MGQCNFLHLWHQKLYRAFRFGTLWPISCSYPRHSQLTRHSLMLANGRIRQSLTALVSYGRRDTCHIAKNVVWLTYSGLPDTGVCMLIYFAFFCHPACALSRLVWGQSYHCLTRAILLLLMPWLLASPGHQHPWYWLNRICRSLSSVRKNLRISTTCVV